MITISLSDYITYAGNLLKCISKRTTILLAKAMQFEGLSMIAKSQIEQSMNELINDSITLEMETCMDYEGGFPHETYWQELRIYIDKYKTQPWQLYNQMKNNIGNGIYASFFRFYAKGVVDDIQVLEGWAQEVRI